MSEEQQNIERTEKFIEDYEKLLTQSTLTKSARARAEKDIEALREVLDMAVRYADLLE